MATRRRPGFINPTLGSTLDQGEINDEAAARQKAINEQAAASYENWRQNQIQQSAQDSQQNQQNLVAAKTNQALNAATGFNTAPQKDTWNPTTQQYERPNTQVAKDIWDPTTNKYVRIVQPGYQSVQPTPQQLQQNFDQLPQPQQALMIQTGKAPFVDPDKASKILSGQNNDVEKFKVSQIQKISDMMADGTAIFNPDDRKFYQMQTDPDNPESGLKKKVPFSPMQVLMTQEGMKRGLIPDIDSFAPRTVSQGVPSDLTNVASTLAGQPVAAANPNPSTPQLAAQLASTKTDVPYDPSNAAGNSTSTMALSPYKYQSNMQLGTDYGYNGTMGIPNDPSQVTPAMARSGIGLPDIKVPPGSVVTGPEAAGAQFAQTVANLGSQTSGMLDTSHVVNDTENLGKGLYNIGAGTVNNIADFVKGFNPNLSGPWRAPIAQMTPDTDPNAQPSPGQDAQDAATRVAMARIRAKLQQDQSSQPTQ